MSSYTIRLMKKADYPFVRIIDDLTQLQYRGESWQRLTNSEKELDLVINKKQFDVNLSTGYSLVAIKTDKKIIGFLLAYETFPFKGTIHVRHIAILPEYQGKGIGKLFYIKLIKIAKKHDIKEIQALINTDNPRSIKMHKDAGFKIDERKEATYALSNKF